jgi:GNAT superfamily N-acetyltransferase
MPEIRRISVEELVEKAGEHFAEHWREAMGTGMREPCEPSIDRYRELEHAGVLVGLAAYDEEAVVGYAVGYVLSHMQCKLIYWQMDSIYVCPSYRGTGLAQRLLDEVERAATERGATQIFIHSPMWSPLRALLIGRGYEEQQVLLRKEVSNGSG